MFCPLVPKMLELVGRLFYKLFLQVNNEAPLGRESLLAWEQEEKKWRRSGVLGSPSLRNDGLEVGEKRPGGSLISCPLRQAHCPDFLCMLQSPPFSAHDGINLVLFCYLLSCIPWEVALVVGLDITLNGRGMWYISPIFFI